MSTQSSNCEGVVTRLGLPRPGSKGQVISIPMSGGDASEFAPGPDPGPGSDGGLLSSRSPSGVVAVVVSTVAGGVSVAQPASATRPA